MNAPWFLRQPLLFRQECKELARDYPEMKLDEEAFAGGRLVFEGTLRVELDSRTELVTLSLEYSEAFPYFPPAVIPWNLPPPGSSSKKTPLFFSARHQMANGSICLFERDPADDPRNHISGVVALRRARTWLPHAMRGHLPQELDSLEAELESHYQRFGDVLLGPTMFEDTSQGGELILAPFPAPLRSEAYPIYMVTHVESGGSWNNDGATLQRIGADRPPEFWAASPPVATELRRVRWYSLDREPQPPQSSSELAHLLFPEEAEPLTQLKQELASDLASRDAIHVPVRFPGRNPGTHEWLFLTVKIRESSLPTAKVDGIQHAGQILDLSGKGKNVLDDAPVGILRTHDLRRSSLEIRNAGRVPKSPATISIGLAGAGSLGSMCADLLSKAGVGQLRVVDPALLNAHNAVRHLAGVREAGMPKSFVVAAITSFHNPHCDVSWEIARGILAMPDDDPIWKMNGILSTIADDSTELALNRLAVARNVTVYYLRALRSGTVGRLLRVRPGIDACLECVGNYHAEADSRAIVIPPQDNEVITRECGQPVLAASGADLAVVAGLAVRKLLLDLPAMEEHNQWIWAMEGIPEHAQLREAFSSTSVALAPHPRCGVCSISAPRKVRISNTARAEILALARDHSPNETGGILIGRRHGELIDILSASDAGPKATSKPTRFERDGAHCQKFLEQMAARLGSNVDYVGEWHSHPESSATPSTRDTDSLGEIAADPDYLTTAPVLIIVAPSQADGRVEWSSTVFPVDGLARTVVLEDLPDDEITTYPRKSSDKPASDSQILSSSAGVAAPSDSTM